MQAPVRILTLLVALHGLAACSPRTVLTPTAGPFAPVPADPVDLTVQLQQDDELCRAYTKARYFEYHLGAPLCELATAVARTTFSRVHVRKNAETATPDAILRVRLVGFEQTQPMVSFHERKTTLLLEWGLDDTRGQPVWLGTVSGESTGPLGTAFSWKNEAKRQTEAALQMLFTASCQALSSSAEIKQFAADVARTRR